MLNKKILKILDSQDILLQRTTEGIVAHSIADNCDKRDENDRINEHSLSSIGFEWDDPNAKEKQFSYLFGHILSCIGEYSTRVRVFKDEESILEETIKEEIECGDEFLIKCLEKLGYEVKKK